MQFMQINRIVKVLHSSIFLYEVLLHLYKTYFDQ